MKPQNLVAKIGDEERYLIQLPIGDWSDDGHGKCDYFFVDSKKPVQNVRSVHFRGLTELGFDIGDMCRKYGEGTLGTNFKDKLTEFGYRFELSDEEEGNLYPTSEELAKAWVFLLNKIDPSLELRLMKVPSITSYEEGETRHLKVPGYGIFE